LKAKYIIVALLLAATVLFAIPLTVLALTHPEALEYYVKALEYALRGLEAYLDFILRLFEKAVSLGV